MLFSSFRRVSRRNIFRVSLLVLVLAGAGAGLVAVRLRPPTPAHASGAGCPVSDFTQLTNPANSPRGVSWTRLSNSQINDDPQAILEVTPNLMPNSVHDNHPIGVYYNGPYWYIYNEDGAPMPMGAAFNVYGEVSSDSATCPGPAFVQTATSANTTSGDTYIDNSGLDGQSGFILQVTQNITPGGGGGVFDPHPIGVGYNTFRERWYIFNQDGTPIPTGASFNVGWVTNDLNALGPPFYGYSGVLQATTTNSLGAYVVINDPSLNDLPNAEVWVTADFVSNPEIAGSGVYENHNLGVFYIGGRWCIVNQDGTPMPNGATFFYLFWLH